MARLALALAAPLPACGCAGHFGDPYSWDVAQVNRVNLAVEAYRPLDLVEGRDAPGGDGYRAAQAIERMRNGLTRSLPSFTTSSLPTPGAVDPPSASDASNGLGGGGGGGPAPAGQ